MLKKAEEIINKQKHTPKVANTEPLLLPYLTKKYYAPITTANNRQKCQNNT